MPSSSRASTSTFKSASVMLPMSWLVFALYKSIIDRFYPPWPIGCLSPPSAPAIAIRVRPRSDPHPPQPAISLSKIDVQVRPGADLRPVDGKIGASAHSATINAAPDARTALHQHADDQARHDVSAAI